MATSSIYRESVRHFLKPVLPLLEDPHVTEVMIVGPDRIYAERAGKVSREPFKFDGEASLMSAVRNIAEYADREIDDHHHSMDGRLPTGERVHAIIPPASRVGTCLTIRKYKSSLLDIGELVRLGSVSQKAAEFLRMCVQLHKNIVVSGGTGTGKTTMLNVLSGAIPDNERVIVIEDTSELKLGQEHTVYLEAQSAGPNGRKAVSIRDLFVDSLRMRPDRIVVGEVRRGEALDLIQSMISGHAGALTTVHANTPQDAATRLETLCLLSDAELPIYVARTQVASAVHLVVQLQRYGDGSRRVSAISECLGLNDQERYEWNSLFEFQGDGLDADGNLLGKLVPTGNLPSFSNEPRQLGLEKEFPSLAEIFGNDMATSKEG